MKRSSSTCLFALGGARCGPSIVDLSVRCVLAPGAAGLGGAGHAARLVRSGSRCSSSISALGVWRGARFSGRCRGDSCCRARAEPAVSPTPVPLRRWRTRPGNAQSSFLFRLQNKEFVCRGHDYERLEAFQQRMLNEFPHAIAMQHANQPDDTIFQAEAQCILTWRGRVLTWPGRGGFSRTGVLPLAPFQSPSPHSSFFSSSDFSLAPSKWNCSISYHDVSWKKSLKDSINFFPHFGKTFL